jgi:hypothetical protein
MSVRGSWPFDGGDGGGDPGQAFIPVALAFAIVWAAAILTVLIVLALKLLA